MKVPGHPIPHQQCYIGQTGMWNSYLSIALTCIFHIMSEAVPHISHI